MSGWRDAPPQCPDCGRFVQTDGGVHNCPGPAVCECGHESGHHLIVSTRSGRGWRYGECRSPFDEQGRQAPCSCKRFRRVPRQVAQLGA